MRPQTLADVARWTLLGQPFDACLAGFLDEFYVVPTPQALAEAPPLLGKVRDGEGQVQDAYLAAVAEELTRSCRFILPVWVGDETRKLHRPWFASSLAALRAVLLLESPAAFRSRNLFVSENALARA